MDEVELKLDLTPEAAAAIVESGLLAADPETVWQRSTYYDTPDHALAKAGLSLRVRQTGDRRIQTVKVNGASGVGLFVRSEWERAVDGDEPVLDDTTPVRSLLRRRVGEITAIFTVEIERRTWKVREGGTAIEVALDRGEAVADGRRAPICEIELELEEGAPAALFMLARRLDAVAPVRLGAMTKAERGYQLTMPVRAAYKAEPVALDSGMTAARAFQCIALSCVRQFRRNEALLLAERSVPALHQARVALRRLRSAFSIFKPMIGADSAARLRDDLRWLASGLGDARNVDVLLERAPPGALRDRLHIARDAAYARVEDMLDGPRARELMLDLAQWLSDGDWLHAAGTEEARGRPVRDFAAAALDRYRRKVKKRGCDLGRLNDEERHGIRKSGKTLRYAAEFFTALFEGKRERRRHKRFVGALEALQDRLGALNDLATAPGILARLDVADDPAAAALLSGGRKKALVDAAAEAHEVFVDARRFWR